MMLEERICGRVRARRCSGARGGKAEYASKKVSPGYPETRGEMADQEIGACIEELNPPEVRGSRRNRGMY